MLPGLMFLIYVFQGFGDRLLSEIRKLAPKDVKIRVSYVTCALCNPCYVV
jgi:hypothetical protein